MQPTRPEGGAPREEPKRNDAVGWKDAVAAAAFTAGVAHALVDVPREEQPYELKTNPVPERPEWAYTEVGGIVAETVFENEATTGGIQDNLVDLHRQAFSAPVGTYFYYDVHGTVLMTAELPEELRALKRTIVELKRAEKDATKVDLELKEKTQAWHNENRRKLPGRHVLPESYKDVGYPFVASPVLPGVDVTEVEEGMSLIGLVTERLAERTQSRGSGPTYFGGEPRSVYDAIVEIARAYDVPRAIVLGIAANESGYSKLIERRDSGARGIFQFTERAYEDARDYAERHPELWSGIRSGKIGPYEESWNDRFVSAELFCAYYHVIRRQVRAPVERLETRLAALDPGYPRGTLADIAAINAYNAGAGRIAACVDRFLSLSDADVRARIGNPPYGVDAWLGVVGTSFGLADKGDSTRVGADVFQYPQKVLAMGTLIMDEENYLSELNRPRVGDEEESILPSFGASDRPSASPVTGVAAAALGAAAIAGALREPEPVSRRSFLHTVGRLFGGAVGAMAVPTRGAMDYLSSDKPDETQPTDEPRPRAEPAPPPVETPRSPESIVPGELYADVLEDASRELDALHAKLLDRAADGLSGWTPDELDAIRSYTAPANRRLLKKEIETMLGADLKGRMDASESQPFSKRKHLYDEATKKQGDYIKREIASGNLVALEADRSDNPAFCEQVGAESGITNKKEAMYARKEFIPVLGTLVALVNEQIDAFNANPRLYGITDQDFPELPHISAVKISGALRFASATKRMFETGKGGRTTPGVSIHWLGNGLDIGSYATPDGHMVRLAGSLRASRKGAPVLRAGEKLPNQGFGKRTREIYSKMIGRALFAMIPSLKKRHGIEIQPLWEGRQLNWHVALKGE